MKNKEILILSNGVKMPIIGFGTWQIPNGDVCYNAVTEALKAGYRHIDTAMAYKNESSVKKAILDYNIPREDIFITTKLPAQIKGYNETIEAFNKSLKELGVDYIDLYLIHAPKPWNVSGDGMEYMPQNIESWKAFEKLYLEGKIKSIGVSNFKVEHLEVLIQNSKIVPHVNQILINPKHYDIETINYCQKKNIAIEAYSPLATGKLLDNSQLEQIAKKYNKSLAQIAIRWSLQRGFIPLPKSVTPERIKENLNIFDFSILDEDMDLINSLK